MQGNTKIEKVLRTAIRKEKEAREFYLDLAGQVEEPAAKDTLTFLADEELKHKEFLEKYMNGEIQEGTLRMSDVVNYKIEEHLRVESDGKPEIEGPMTPRKAFLIAAGEESRAHQFYIDLADIHPSGPVKDLILGIAAEELRHKEKMEYLYTNTAFPQTAGG
jgi:rubrerythrin